MKLGAREKKIIIILAGALIFAATYFFLFQKMQEQNEIISSKIEDLNKQLKELNLKISHENEYVAQTNAMQRYVEDTVYRFPSFMQIEDGIMNVVDLEDDAEIKVSVVKVSDPAPVAVGGRAARSEDGAAARTTPGAASSSYELYDVVTEVNYESGYENLKYLLGRIVRTGENPRSMGILSAVYDNTTGTLSGSAQFHTFFILGLDKDYTAPYIPPMGIGTNNPFGTINRVEPQESQGE